MCAAIDSEGFSTCGCRVGRDVVGCNLVVVVLILFFFQLGSSQFVPSRP